MTGGERLRRLAKGEGGPPLFLVHPITGLASTYETLVKHLPRHPLYAFDARGLNAGEEPARSIEDMAAEYVELIQKTAPRGPHHLGGWSFGGLIAYEMAQLLGRAGAPVGLLAVIDARVPTAQMRPAGDDNELAIEFLQHHAFRSGRPLEVHSLPEGPEAALRVVRAEAERLGAIEPSMTDAELQRRLHVFAAHVRAFVAYRPGPFTGRVTLLQSADDLPEHPRPKSLGWETCARELTVHLVRGNHFNLLDAAQAPGVAEAIEKSLAEAKR